MGMGGLDALMAGGGGPPGADAGADPGGGAGGTPGQADTPEFQAQIDIAMSALMKAAGMPEDDTDLQIVQDCMSKLQQFKANVQKEKDAALGVTPVHKGVRRAMRGAGGGGSQPY